MSDWLGVLALSVPALHALLMGMIGYPFAMRRRNGMQKFHRSGFTWWLIALTVVLVLVLTTHPGQLDPGNPASGGLTAHRVILTALLALVGCFCVESFASLLQRARKRSVQDRGTQRYESALPDWARTPGVEMLLLTATAVLEEAVYRGIGLTWLRTDAGASAAVAVGISAVAFGAAHWYYGPRQIVLKSLLGVILGIAALTAGWLTSAIAHVALNALLVALAWRVGRSDDKVAA
ncbi:MAG: CPBP family intramembrane glutamic endopeptidase [Solirubrobacterales bacterium]